MAKESKSADEMKSELEAKMASAASKKDECVTRLGARGARVAHRIAFSSRRPTLTPLPSPTCVRRSVIKSRVESATAVIEKAKSLSAARPAGAVEGEEKENSGASAQ